MAAAGANVIVSARNQNQLEQLVEELNTLGNGSHLTLAMDLEDTNGISDKINALLDQNPIHILVNNAAGPPGGPLLDSTVEELTQPFGRHLHAAHTLVRLLVPTMESEGYGRIIQIVSTSVREPIPNLGVSNTPVSYTHLTLPTIYSV